MCQAHWQRMYKYGDTIIPPKKPKPLNPPCKIAGCERLSRSRNSKYCEKHFYRVRRGADPAIDPTHKRRYQTASGYTIQSVSSHPLASKDKRLYEHRRVAYDKHQGECPDCGWCGKELVWSLAVIDHLNEDKSDNRPRNLKVCCNACNRARGAMLGFIKNLKDDSAVSEFFRLVRDYRNSKTKS